MDGYQLQTVTIIMLLLAKHMNIFILIWLNLYKSLFRRGNREEECDE